MKNRHLLLKLTTLSLLAISSCSSNIRKADASDYFVYSDEIIYPYNFEDSYTLSGTISYYGTLSYEDVIVMAECHHYKDNKDTFFALIEASENKNLVPGMSLSYSFTLNKIYRFIENGLLIKLSVMTYYNKKAIVSKEFRIVNKSSEVINVDDYRSYPYEINRLYKQNGDLFIESYLFDKISNKEIIPYYYRFDINTFSFIYQSIIPFTLDESYLRFIDTYHLFPSLRIEEDGYKYIPLTFEQTDNRIYLRFKNMYVSKDTLDMSLSYKLGYLGTSYLYFPNNHENELQGYTFEINLVNMGANGIAVHHEVMLNTSKLLIGPCNDSTYCIIGGKA